MTEIFRVLVLGDTHARQSFGVDGGRSASAGVAAAASGYLGAFLEACDSVVLNFEVPREGEHRGVAEHLLHEVGVDEYALRALGVDAVNLAARPFANDREMGLTETLDILREHGVGWFGAGHSLARATEPYGLSLPDRVGGGKIYFHGSVVPSMDDSYLYADADSAGSAPLRIPEVPGARRCSAPEDAFHIALPHWGDTGGWRTANQYKLAHRFLNKDYDLVLGHAGNALQEVHRKRQRWVVYGTGTSTHRPVSEDEETSRADCLRSFSLLPLLEVTRSRDSRRLILKLYPLRPGDDAANGPSPVSPEEFDHVVRVLSGRPIRTWRFSNSAMEEGTDELGAYLSLDQGWWPLGKRPSRLNALAETGDPGEWPLRGPSTDLEDEVLALDKHHGAMMLSLGAKAEGGSTQWLSDSLGLIELDGKRLLALRSSAHESALGSNIVGDKVLAARLLEEAGVSTPVTRVAATADEAVRLAETLSGPVVVKPRAGHKSKGVSTGLVGDHEIREAFALAKAHGSQVIVQQHVEVAEEMRVMAAAEGVVAVNVRVFPHVIGDGVSTLEQLIEDKNLQRTLNPTLVGSPIPVDTLTHRQLKHEGLELWHVLESGKTVTIRKVGGLSVGADIWQNLEGASEQLKDTAQKAVAAIPGLGWGGVDVIIEKNTGKSYVIEINTSAGYSSAMFPTYGNPLEVGAALWKLRYAAVPRDSEDGPYLPQLNREAPLIGRDKDRVSGTNSVGFSRLFENSLEQQNFLIEHKNHRVNLVTSPEGRTTWVTRSGLTGTDRFAVRQVLKRHQWVVRLLDIADVPHITGKTLRSREQLVRVMAGSGREVVLVPISSGWDGPDIQHLTKQDPLERWTMSERMWLQPRPKGARLRILATRRKAWVVTSASPMERSSEANIKDACYLAVDAVRAIPELRWAAVDVVVRAPGWGRSGGVYVEGLTQQPRFLSTQRVLAGDFDRFCRAIVDAGNVF